MAMVIVDMCQALSAYKIVDFKYEENYIEMYLIGGLE